MVWQGRNSDSYESSRLKSKNFPNKVRLGMERPGWVVLGLAGTGLARYGWAWKSVVKIKKGVKI